jgi:fluoride exporter
LGRLAWICAGGAFGTGCRYLLSTWLTRALGPVFPWGTLAVNLIGSFLLGVIMEVGLNSSLLSPTVRWTLGAGVVGGFTTYSSFNYETMQLVQGEDNGLALLNVGATLLGCWVTGLLGLWVGRLVVRG